MAKCPECEMHFHGTNAMVEGNLVLCPRGCVLGVVGQS
jgi:hypothetical protein